jgi:PAS domain S-box-containing protein
MSLPDSRGEAVGRWQAVIASAVDGIVVIDACGRIEAFNPAAERLFGYSESEVIGRNVSMLMPAPYGDEHDGYLARYLTEGGPRIIGIGREVSGKRRDGSIFPLHLSVGETSIDGQRKFTGILHDLTARVQLEDRLRRSEARWRAVVESAVDGIVVIDAAARIEAFNAAAERLFGYAEDEVLGHNVNMLMPSPYHEEHDGYLARYLATSDPHVIGRGREVAGRRKDGTTFPFHLSVGEMSVNGERRFTGILHDLTDRVRMEEQLREQEALARLGEMAAVIAHEVKNPLAGVRGAIEILGRRLPANEGDARVVKEILNRLDSLSELMKDMLLFARPPQPHPAPVDVRPLVALTVDLLKSDPALTQLTVDIVGAAPPVPADAQLLQIVFLNLLVNGAQAVKGQGRLTVSVSSSETACMIAFNDTGPGVPAHIRQKIFTPFFTTKARGTGLGLPTAKRLVEAHHGSIHLECPPGGGTTVTVRLPAVELHERVELQRRDLVPEAGIDQAGSELR